LRFDLALEEQTRGSNAFILCGYAIVLGLLPKNGLMGNVDLGFQGADRSQVARGPNPQLLIALHSPDGLLKPDCASASQRKAPTVTYFAAE